MIRGIDNGAALRGIDRIIVVRFHVGQFLKARPIGIDEAQFFDEEIANVCDELAFRGIRVIVAGLDMDYLGKPFGQMPFIMAKADYVTKLHAICMQCGNIANYSYRKIPNEDQVMLGAKDVYEPRCRNCYHK